MLLAYFFTCDGAFLARFVLEPTTMLDETVAAEIHDSNQLCDSEAKHWLEALLDHGAAASGRYHRFGKDASSCLATIEAESNLSDYRGFHPHCEASRKDRCCCGNLRQSMCLIYQVGCACHSTCYCL